MRIPISQARAGDILLFKGDGIFYQILSRLIKWLKEPCWNREQWHMAPVVGFDIYLDAQWPRLKISHISEALKKGKQITAYRIMEQPPEHKVADFVKRYKGKRYDWFVYILTALAVFLRPRFDFPRLIDKRYTCWEVSWDFIDEMGTEFQADYEYPFITEFLGHVGEL